MKKCPNCNQIFDDDNDFCPNDGTRFATGYDGFMSSREVPTQYVAHPQTSQPLVVSQSPKWIFPLVGVLCGLAVVLGFFAFFRDSPSVKSEITQKNAEVSEPGNNIDPVPLPRAVTTPVPTIPPPPTTISSAFSVVTVNSPRDHYLALKSEPCAAPCGTMVLKIPHGTRLSLGTCKDHVEVVDRRQGRWCSTSYDGYSGWVFDAFVTR